MYLKIQTKGKLKFDIHLFIGCDILCLPEVQAELDSQLFPRWFPGKIFQGALIGSLWYLDEL